MLTSLADSPAEEDEDRAGLPYEARNDSCDSCSKPLGTAPAITLPRAGQSYHAGCLSCTNCHEPFGRDGGDRSFVENNGRPFHPSVRPFHPAFITNSTSPPTVRPSIPLATKAKPRALAAPHLDLALELRSADPPLAVASRSHPYRALDRAVAVRHPPPPARRPWRPPRLRRM